MTKTTLIFLPISMLMMLEFNALPVNKCCPLDQQLRGDLRACVPYTKATDAKEDNAWNVSLPWWMGDNLRLHDAQTLRPKSSEWVVDEDKESVRYGVTLPCPWHSTYFVSTRSKQSYIQLTNGTLLLNASSSLGSVALDPGEYCVDRLDHENPRGVFLYLACPCEKVLCVRKCCRKSNMLALKELRKTLQLECTSANASSWTPSFSSDASQTSVPYMLLEKVPECSRGSRLVSLNTEENQGRGSYRIFPNGSAVVEDFGFGLPYPAHAYCSDRTRLVSGATVDNVLFCHKARADVEPTTRATLYGSFYALGSVFLALTLLVYGLLPDLRNSPHAKALMSHVAAMLLASVSLAMGQLSSVMASALCYAVALLVQFSFLAAFFWLNVMCVDIALTFRSLRSSRGSRQEGQKRKFLLYCVYAWGCPVVMAVVTAILEFEESIPKHLDFGIKHCWFHTKTATLIYFYGPMAILLLVNLLLFIYTAFRILKIQRETAILNNAESGRHEKSSKDRKRLTLYLKLFCLMGITWITEIISFLHGVDTYYYITDCINLLRGIFIFVIFCCKKKILRSLQKQLATCGVCSRLLGPQIPSSGPVRAGQRNPKSATHSTALGVPVATNEPRIQRTAPLLPQSVCDEQQEQQTGNKTKLRHNPVPTVSDEMYISDQT